MSGKEIVERVTENAGFVHWHLVALERRQNGVYKKVRDMLPGILHLDVGCGEGFLLEELDYAVGVDLLDKYIRNAKNASKPIVKADALRLPFRDGVFDSLSYLFVLYNLYDEFVDGLDVKSKKVEALKEGYRTMKGNGTLLALIDIDDMLPYGEYLKEVGFEVEKTGVIRKNILFGYHNFIRALKRA